MVVNKIVIDGVAVLAITDTALNDTGCIIMADIKQAIVTIPLYPTTSHGVCRCSAYHFPHRKGGGRCGKFQRDITLELQKRFEQEILKSLMIPPELFQNDDSIHQIIKRGYK